MNVLLRREVAWSVLVSGSIFCALSCAQERDPIDRTQPNALEKTFFVGEALLDPADDPEFYFQGTLVDVGYGAVQDGLFTSTYAQPMTRIKWVIQEEHLVARLTYERIEGSDGKGAGPSSRDGQVVAMYRIESHFDVRRGYNPITGEPTNIVEENTTDRPWYDRKYMRVDWSENLNTDAYELDTLSQVGLFGGVEYMPLRYYVNDPGHPDAPHFDPLGGYFDVTNKAFAKPASVDISHLGWGIEEYPACFLPSEFSGGTAPSGNCNPVELTIRNSFRRVVDTDYVPQDWDGYRFQAFGAFYTERRGYDRLYGMSDEEWRRLISRYNIWDRSHAYEDPIAMTGPVECFTPGTTPFGADPRRDEDEDGTHDECKSVGAGSQCDTFRQRCTLPYRERSVRPLVWYYTSGSDPDFFEPTLEAANQWDAALRSAVQTARYAECVATGEPLEICRRQYPVLTGQQTDNDDLLALVEEVDDCRYGRAYSGENCGALAERLADSRGYDEAVAAIAQMEEMVVLCHSPVQDKDAEVCGDRGLEVRLGDLRYHQVNVIGQPQTPSPWGIYSDSHDPLTGETVAASINVWSQVDDFWAQGIVDRLRYMFGELTTEQITDGEHVADWVTANQASLGGGILPGMSRTELARRVAAFAGTGPEEMRRTRQSIGQNQSLLARMHALEVDLQDVRADARAPSTNAALYHTRRSLAVGTETEAELNTPMMQALAGTDQLPGSSAMLRYSSPLQGNHPHLARDLTRLRQLGRAERHACVRHEAPSPTSLRGLGDILQEKFGAFSIDDSPAAQAERAARMQAYLARQAHLAVILHEMGHSIGMRHNFVSSSDAMNYRPQYWQLRTRNKQETAPCTDLASDGATCVGPRWFDPVTEEERSQLIWMFMHSSVMDYAGENTQDLMGLGAYDFAATQMFYGDVVSVHDDPSYQVGGDRAGAVLAKQDNFGGILGFRWSRNGNTGNAEIHYSQLDQNFDLIRDCREVNPEDFKPAEWDESTLGRWHPVLDGKLVAVEGRYSRCQQQAVDYVPWGSLRPPTTAEANGMFLQGGPGVDPENRPRVAHGFATDRWADLGNLAVYRHDNGADAYELFNFLITEQEVNHIFDNYRRGRSTFSVRSAAYRTLERYNEKMRDGAKGLGLFANIYRDFALAQGLDFQGLWPAVIGTGPEGDYNGLATNALAAGLAFDHFTRLMGRPESGSHYLRAGDPVLRSSNDAEGNPGAEVVVVPNGPTGLWSSVSIGGKPVENRLADDKGEFDSDFTLNAGSYYDKVFSTMLLTESVDNFISASRRDFTDARYRAVSMADLMPDGYRRWLANNLTNDDEVKAAFVASSEPGQPMVNQTDMFPSEPIGWTSWWGEEPSVCFPARDSTVCASPVDDVDFGERSLPVTPIDPQVGWEQQKFLISWTLMYLPENQQRYWLDRMNIWVLGDDADPGFDNRIELHHPNGQVYVAKTFGKEEIFGKVVQKGVGARILEYANGLLRTAYRTTPGPDLDGDGGADWYIPALRDDGQPDVLWDPSISHVVDGFVYPNGSPGCNAFDFSQCTCDKNRACVTLDRYVAVPNFMRQAMRDFGLADPSMRGLF